MPDGPVVETRDGSVWFTDGESTWSKLRSESMAAPGFSSYGRSSNGMVALVAVGGADREGAR
jgi:hypothetical protein